MISSKYISYHNWRLESVGLTFSHANSWELWVYMPSKERRNSTVPWYIACVLFLASIHFVFELWGHICSVFIKNNLCAISSLRTYLKIIMRSPLNDHFDKFSRQFLKSFTGNGSQITGYSWNSSLNSSQSVLHSRKSIPNLDINTYNSYTDVEQKSRITFRILINVCLLTQQYFWDRGHFQCDEKLMRNEHKIMR